jgi:hypothetical protein
VTATRWRSLGARARISDASDSTITWPLVSQPTWRSNAPGESEIGEPESSIE